jgi:hypothetical protein
MNSMQWAAYIARMMAAGAVGSTIGLQGTASLGANSTVSQVTSYACTAIGVLLWDYVEAHGEKGRGPLKWLKKNRAAITKAVEEITCPNGGKHLCWNGIEVPWCVESCTSCRGAAAISCPATLPNGYIKS